MLVVREAQEDMVILVELEPELDLVVLEVRVDMGEVLVEQEDLVVLDKEAMELEEQQELVDKVLVQPVAKAVMVQEVLELVTEGDMVVLEE